MDAKLATARLSAIRWALTTMRENAMRHGADLVVVLVPAANDPASQQTVFEGPRQILRELDIPTVDLLDTFKDVKDFSEFRVIEGDVHPNQEGHRLIFEALRRELGRNPIVAATMLGKEPDGQGLP
jgi:hypothetical protein